MIRTEATDPVAWILLVPDPGPEALEGLQQQAQQRVEGGGLLRPRLDKEDSADVPPTPIASVMRPALWMRMN